MNFLFYGFYLAPAVLGGAVGLVWIYLLTQRQLRAIEKKGEIVGTRRRNLLGLFGAVIVIAVFILLAIHIPAILTPPTLSLGDIFLLSSYSSNVFLLRRWERKHKKEILMDGGWLQGRIYASEKTPPPPPQLLPPPPPPDI